MKALSSISCRTKCPNYSRSGPFLPDISFSILTETANSDKKENPDPRVGRAFLCRLDSVEKSLKDEGTATGDESTVSKCSTSRERFPNSSIVC